MKTSVVFAANERQVEPARNPFTVVRIVESGGKSVVPPTDGEDDGSDESAKEPPFWTWFIENPRTRPES